MAYIGICIPSTIDGYTTSFNFFYVEASIRLETTSRKTQPHMAQSHWIVSKTTEHRSFLPVERGSVSRTLASIVDTATLKKSMPW